MLLRAAPSRVPPQPAIRRTLTSTSMVARSIAEASRSPRCCTCAQASRRRDAARGSHTHKALQRLYCEPAQRSAAQPRTKQGTCLDRQPLSVMVNCLVHLPGRGGQARRSSSVQQEAPASWPPWVPRPHCPQQPSKPAVLSTAAPVPGWRWRWARAQSWQTGPLAPARSPPGSSPAPARSQGCGCAVVRL